MADSTPTLKQRLSGRSLYLVGMMGSGKTLLEGGGGIRHDSETAIAH